MGEELVQQDLQQALTPSPFGDLDEITVKGILSGDYSRLSQDQKNKLYMWRCMRDGLDFMSKPYVWATMGGKVVLVPTKGKYEQIRKREGLNCIIAKEEYLPSFKPQTGEVDKLNQFYKVWVEVSDPRTGRREQNFSAGFIGAIQGLDRSNEEKKILTQAQNRATMAFLGEGSLDDTQVEDVRGGKILKEGEPKRLAHTASNVVQGEVISAEVVK